MVRCVLSLKLILFVLLVLAGAAKGVEPTADRERRAKAALALSAEPVSAPADPTEVAGEATGLTAGTSGGGTLGGTAVVLKLDTLELKLRGKTYRAGPAARITVNGKVVSAAAAVLATGGRPAAARVTLSGGVVTAVELTTAPAPAGDAPGCDCPDGGDCRCGPGGCGCPADPFDRGLPTYEAVLEAVGRGEYVNLYVGVRDPHTGRHTYVCHAQVPSGTGGLADGVYLCFRDGAGVARCQRTDPLPPAAPAPAAVVTGAAYPTCSGGSCGAYMGGGCANGRCGK